MIIGDIRGLAGGTNDFEQRWVAGNHFEFGPVSVEVSTAFDLHAAFTTRSLQVSLGRRVGDSR